MAGKYKTMTLIEEGELERLRQRQIKDYNPALKSLGFVQDQIEKLFNDSELDDESKHKILCYLQNKFGTLYKNFKNGPANMPPVVMIPPVVAAEDQDELPVDDQPPPPGQMDVNEQLEDVNEEIKEENEEKFDDALNSGEFALQVNLPSQYQKKFELFQTFLAQHKKEIHSNAAGELVLDNNIIPNSSLADLLRSFYVRSHSMNLIGLPDFLTKLKSLKVDPESSKTFNW
ncbi:MAG: hypothetical protein FD143_3619 [Ignavibacteria bacterium]|nr:MAG: hypothetical protein FD143_3619 [Ignavibacteria bacterium]